MKKAAAFTLAFMLVISLAGCATQPQSTVPATNATVPATQATVPATQATMPTIIDPTMGTNIPDPSVDTSMEPTQDSTEDSAAMPSDGNASRQRRMGMR